MAKGSAAKNDAPLMPSEQEQDAAARKLLAKPTQADVQAALDAGDAALARDLERSLTQEGEAA